MYTLVNFIFHAWHNLPSKTNTALWIDYLCFLSTVLKNRDLAAY